MSNSYDINAIKEKIRQLSQSGGGGSNGNGQAERIKLSFWKPTVGNVEIRFIPYNTKSGEPFEGIGYYNSKMLSERRLVAPCQWDKPDPVYKLVEELREDRQNDATWKLMNQLRLKESYYAPIIVRGQEDKGVQVWELGPTVLNDIYSVLAHPDWVDEDLFSPEKGYDFTVETSLTGKKFNGYDVKAIKLMPRKKSTKLANSKAAIESILKNVPDIESYFKQFCMGENKLKDLVTNFLSNAEGATTGEAGTEKTASTSESTVDEEATSKIEAAFDDIG